MSALTQMNLGDPELEVLDPTPNVYSLFNHFDKTFFWTKLASRAVVRWSKRMYSCAGVCSYEGSGGLCQISLSEPLLKLRPRKDLVETLLHEMIHAFLFVTCRDQDRDGHGPNFKAHMHRINQCAGLNISIYHDFHDEVKLYLTHWWRCDGPCQKWKPYFGIVRRSVNKAPGPYDYWWTRHEKTCGGTYVKIKEPEKTTKKTASKAKNKSGDITKYINKNNVTNKTLLKDSNSNIVKAGITATKSNSSSTLVVTKKGENNKPVAKITSPVLFSGKGVTLNDGRRRSNSVDVIKTVRNVWSNKTLTGPIGKQIKGKEVNKRVCDDKGTNPNKHKAESNHKESTPAKIKKIDDYFIKAATLLKDIYGVDFDVTETKNKKIIATAAPKTDLVDCPICNAKIDSRDINTHLDECLNKDVIKSLAKSDNIDITNTEKPESSTSKDYKQVRTNIDNSLFKMKTENGTVSELVKKEITNTINLTDIDFKPVVVNTETNSELDSKQLIDTLKTNKNMNNTDIKPIKIEPGTSKQIEFFTKCACCGSVVDKPIEQHLDECLAFFNNSKPISEEGASTSFAGDTIVIDDDVFDESMTMNATGTKTPCPCCMEMVEIQEMNQHLDNCLL